MKTVLIIFALITLLACVGTYNAEEAMVSQDSLEELATRCDSLSTAMEMASEILDKIDLKRGNTTSLMEKKRPITDRLDELKEYIRLSEERIDRLEKDLKSARLETNAYSMMADAFRNEVKIRDAEIQVLSDSGAVRTLRNF